MKGKKVLALMLLAVMLLSLVAGCAPKPDDILGMVGETPIYRWNFEAYLDRQVELYQEYYGVDMRAPENAATYEKYKVERLNDLVGEAALKEEARVRGLYNLTAEQEAEIENRFMQYYETSIFTLMLDYGANEEGRRQAEKAFDEMLKESSLTTDRVRAMYRDSYVIELLAEATGAYLDVTEEEVQISYDQLLKEQKTIAETDPNNFGENPPAVIVYAPEGYVKTLRIKKAFTPEQQRKLDTSYAAVQQAIQKLSTSATVHGENAAGTLLAKETLERTMATYEEVYQKCLDELRVEVEALRAEIDNAAEFENMVGDETDDTNIVDYYVRLGSDHLEDTYIKAALDMKEVGEISQPVDLNDGVCLILLEEIVESGERAYDDVKDQIREDIETSRRIQQEFAMRSEFETKALDAGIVTLYENRI